MALHPQAAAVLAQHALVWRDVDAIRAMTPERARAEQLASLADAPPLPPGVETEELEVPGAAGLLPARILRPSAQPLVGTVLWIRGGGFVLGSLEADVIPAPLALASGCAVVSFEYRLAPEHPFPAGLEDCYAVARWVAGHTRELTGREGLLAVGGDSAGGNLAAALALLIRERGGPQLALQALLCPMTARRFDGPSRHDPDVGALARPEAIEWHWRQYLADEAEGASPFASPLDAASLAGLPPALVVTAEYDVLRDEGEAYARRLQDAGVPVEQRRFDGMHHSFVDRHDAIAAGRECIELLGSAFRRALAPGV